MVNVITYKLYAKSRSISGSISLKVRLWLVYWLAFKGRVLGSNGFFAVLKF